MPEQTKEEVAAPRDAPKNNNPSAPTTVAADTPEPKLPELSKEEKAIVSMRILPEAPNRTPR